MTRLPDDATLVRRVWVENVEPRVDDGRFAVKCCQGDSVVVTADVFADGHDRLRARLCYRAVSESTWREVEMQAMPNDHWRGVLSVEALEPHEYVVEGWVDPFGTWRDGLAKKVAVHLDVDTELAEGALLLEAAAKRADDEAAKLLEELAASLRDDRPQAERVTTALSEQLATLVGYFPDRTRATRSRPHRLDVSRTRARAGAWYEMFPRSCGPEPTQSGTFRQAEGRLDAIAAMGFDVLYIPPIHPIGTTHRKGPNNTLAAEPGAPGSPWAIGAESGGHKAVHPDLGTLEDFDHFVEAARQRGLEVALDIAFQCSPDHPYVREHPQWFRKRPDGTIKYAENPPKKYQDIYPLDFECDDWKALWAELESVLLFWAERGVRIFRVDNPHTKSLNFWQWVIARTKSQYPDLIYLAEAFTRPRVMYGLAKGGFDQSYTYFTWRNTKWELETYLRELTETEARHFLRPNFFANTPDILPEYLQLGGRAAFQARLVLAATLGATYGIYSGFELCENEALPDREEYANSEKYEIRHRDWDRPGNLTALIKRVNEIRRENPALLSNDRLRFHRCDNEQILFFSKTTDDLGNIVLVAVNLDPHHRQSGWVEVPTDLLQLPEHVPYQVHDLLGDGRYLWTGQRNYIELDPQACPAQIFRLRRHVRREHDFDYYL